MKFLIIALCVGCAYASAVDDAHAEAVKYDFDIYPEGGYQWNFESSNGIAASAQGTVKDAALTVQGTNSYVVDGEQYAVSYTADENGFHPQGPHLPTPHPIPEYIARALQYISDHPAKEDARYKRSSLNGAAPETVAPGSIRKKRGNPLLSTTYVG